MVNVSGEIEGSFQCFHELTISELPDQFRVTSLSRDKLIESVAHNILPWEGCMWHPERSLERNIDFDRRLSKLFNE
jgi:putative glutamine amidotransferase